MPTVIKGQRTAVTGSAIASAAILQASIVVNMDDDIFQLDANKAPLALLSSKVSSKSVHRDRFDWMEDERIPSYITVATAATAEDVTIGVGSGEANYYSLEESADASKAVLLKNQRTGEVVAATAHSASDSTILTVSRSWGATTWAAMVVGDVLSLVGSAYGAGVTSGQPRSTLKVEKQNYTQIFRTPFQFTNTELATQLYGPDDLTYQQKKRGVEHAIEIEQAMWWGESASEASTNAQQSTGGLDEIISTNSYNFGGSFNLVNLFSVAEDIFRWKDSGSDTKLLFGAPAVISNISLEAANLLRTVRDDQTFGVNISRLETPHGDFMVIKHNLFEGAEYAKYAYVVDPANIGWCYLRGRNTKFLSDIQENDRDGRKFEYLTEGGLMRKGEKTHGRIKNAA
jgi:hypothetical protein